jgi:pimeloyl-ACP methyl ester carboxylesterase
MMKTVPLHPSDLRGLCKLTIAGVTGLTETVEQMHHTISRFPLLFGRPAQQRMGGISGLVYGSIRGITRAVGGAIDMALIPVAPALAAMMKNQNAHTPERDAFIAAINGILGDYMAGTGNPLAISMQMRLHGQPLEIGEKALSKAIGAAENKLLIMVHGLCRNDLQWNRKGHDHGAAIARDLGYSVVYLHYNTGLHVSENGKSFANEINALTEKWPVPLKELSIIAHSMGGLVTRSACHYGSLSGHEWLEKLKKIIFLGTPHHGTTAERMGNRLEFILGITPYSAPLARLGSIRSAGITDLRYGSVLREDWEGTDRFADSKDRRVIVPLPDKVRCYAIGAVIGKKDDTLGRLINCDGLVPLESALGRHKKPAYNLDFPKTHQYVKNGINHFDLLNHPDIYKKINAFIQ